MQPFADVLQIWCRKTTWSSRPKFFLRKGMLKICTKFTGEHPCRSVISIKLLCIFFEIARRYGFSLVNLLHNIRTPFPKNNSGRLLLNIVIFKGKHLCWRLFLTKLQVWKACSFIKKRLHCRFFNANIAKFLRTTFFLKHFRWLILFVKLCSHFVKYLCWIVHLQVQTSEFIKINCKMDILHSCYYFVLSLGRGNFWISFSL